MRIARLYRYIYIYLNVVVVSKKILFELYCSKPSGRVFQKSLFESQQSSFERQKTSERPLFPRKKRSVSC